MATERDPPSAGRSHFRHINAKNIARHSTLFVSPCSGKAWHVSLSGHSRGGIFIADSPDGSESSPGPSAMMVHSSKAGNVGQAQTRYGANPLRHTNRQPRWPRVSFAVVVIVGSRWANRAIRVGPAHFFRVAAFAYCHYCIKCYVADANEVTKSRWQSSPPPGLHLRRHGGARSTWLWRHDADHLE